MPRTKQPNSKMCFVCGLENQAGLHLHIYELESGTVEAMYTAPEHYQGFPGVLHGGIIGALIDEMAARSLMGSDPIAPRFMYTGRLTLKYRQHVPILEPLRLVGRAGHRRGKAAEAWGGIFLAATGALLAEGDALLVDAPSSPHERERLQEIGWRVHPE